VAGTHILLLSIRQGHHELCAGAELLASQMSVPLVVDQSCVWRIHPELVASHRVSMMPITHRAIPGTQSATMAKASTVTPPPMTTTKTGMRWRVEVGWTKARCTKAGLIIAGWAESGRGLTWLTWAKVVRALILLLTFGMRHDKLGSGAELMGGKVSVPLLV